MNLKKNLFQASLVVVGLLVGGIAFAINPPTVNITTIDGQDASSGSVTLTVPLLPTTVTINGVMTNDPNISSLNSFTLADNGTVFYSINPSGPHTDTLNFSAPWTINSTGLHTITATATHGNADGTDSVDVTVILNGVVTVNQCPAAPAIAGDYMKGKGVKSGSALWKNVINAVAGETGSKGSLWAAHSCDAGYSASVISYIHSHFGTVGNGL